jgi:hypothetical protein
MCRYRYNTWHQDVKCLTNKHIIYTAKVYLFCFFKKGTISFRKSIWYLKVLLWLVSTAAAKTINILGLKLAPSVFSEAVKKSFTP